MNDTQAQMPDGKWVPAKQEPYFPSWGDSLLCWLGFHQLRVSEKYRGTKTCFVCGKRKTGFSHY